MASSASGERQRLTRRVFISSTSVDLSAHRERVRDALLSLGLFPVGMEQFGAQGIGDATSVSTDKVADCDAYLGIVAWRYGYVPRGAARSVTHEEYEEAGRLGLPRYMFLADPKTEADDGAGGLFPASARDPEHGQQLAALRAEIGQAHVVDFFTTPADLGARVATALGNYLLRVQREELTRSPRPPHDLPPRAAGLVGRDAELGELAGLLRGGGERSPAAALVGMAGVGKSALAAEVIRALAGEPGGFPGGVTWVRCDGRVGLTGLAWLEEQVLGAWGVTLTPEELGRATSPEAEVDLRERALRTRLRPPGGAPGPLAALVLLDNVERDLPLDRALDVLGGLGMAALVTARHEPASPRLRVVSLDVLGPDAAVRLLGERYAERGGAWDPARDGAAAAEVVEALGRLPLAIELAAVRAARSRTGIATLAEELREADRLGRLRDPLDRTRSVRYAFERSLALLDGTQRARFAALGLPDGPDWPRPLIERVLAAVADGGGAAATAADDLDVLAALSLLTLADPPAGGDRTPRVRLHPLLRELAREEWARQPATTRRGCLAALMAAVEDLAAARKGDFAALAREEDLIAGAVRRAVAEEVAPAQAAAAVDALSGYLDLGGRWRLGLELSQLQLKAGRAAGDRLGEGDALNNLGYLAQRLARLGEAASAYEEALAVRREAGDRAGEGETLNNLGGLASELGHHEEAARYYQDALAVRREVGDRAGEGITLGNLGYEAAALGRLEEAAGHYERAVAIQREVGDRAGEATTLNNLGGLSARLGRPEEAARRFEEALAIQREVGDRAGEATTLNNLGGLAEGAGRLDEAAQYYERALALRRELGDRSGEGTTLNNLGVLANKLGRQEEAVRRFEEALAVEREVGDRAGEGATLSNLGVLARAMLRGGEAARYFEQALPIQREVGDRAGEGITLNNLGLLAYAQGRRQEAVAYFEQALTILDGIGSGESARVVRENLAALAADQAAAAAPAPATATPPMLPPGAAEAPGRGQPRGGRRWLPWRR